MSKIFKVLKKGKLTLFRGIKLTERELQWIKYTVPTNQQKAVENSLIKKKLLKSRKYWEDDDEPESTKKGEKIMYEIYSDYSLDELLGED